MYVVFYGNSHTEMDQAPWSFRPRDARDRAADCDNHYGDCYPSQDHQSSLGGYLEGMNFLTDQVGYSIPVSFTMALDPPAYMNGGWLAGTSTNYGTDPATFSDYIFEASQNYGVTISADGLRSNLRRDSAV